MPVTCSARRCQSRPVFPRSESAFFILFGLGTRVVAAAGLGAYLAALALEPAPILAVEYVPGFLAVGLLGGGRPGADHMLWCVAERFGGALDRFERYAPTVLRVGLGAAFAYLGLVEELANPARALRVVERYDRTAVVPVDPGLWVVGAGLTEIGVGVLLVAGAYTRGAAAVAFLTLVGTLFGLPDDPVFAHVTLFGMLSAVFTLGAGPYSLDAWLATASPRADRSAVGARPADD